MSTPPDSPPRQQPQSQQQQHEYIIWPRHENTIITPETVKATESAIRSLTNSTEAIENYTSLLNGLRCWFVVLTVAQAARVEKLDGVRGVQMDGPDPDQTDDGHGHGDEDD